VLTVGVGLIVAPLVVFFRDLERAVKLALRFLFYASTLALVGPAVGERLPEIREALLGPAVLIGSKGRAAGPDVVLPIEGLEDASV
ncbi:hypothetical protein ACFXJJ_32060, partial [Streptomyces sp. NPDC059233]